MYKNISIRNLRCYDNVSIDKLNRINLFVGKNNVGKTTLLEALLLLCARHNPEISTVINVIRGFSFDYQNLNSTMIPPWDYNFNNQKDLKEIVIEGEYTETGLEKVVIRSFEKTQSIFDSINGDIPKNLSASATISAISSDLKTKVLEYETEDLNGPILLHNSLNRNGIERDYNEIKDDRKVFFRSSKYVIDQKSLATNLEPFLKNGQESLIDVLKIIDQKIERIFITYENNAPIVYCGFSDNSAIPIVTIGDGISRLIGMFTEIYHMKNGAYLIDEIENGFHYSVMDKIWLAIRKMAAESNVQVFATTHSRECAVAAQKAFGSIKYDDFYLHRLERIKGEIKCITYDLETLESAIDLGLEFR